MPNISTTASSLARFGRDAEGATILEYALLASLASVVVIIALLAFFRT